MIHEVDAALQNLIGGVLRAGSAKAKLSFDPPTPEWAGKVTRPCVDLFLFDVREDTTGRDGAWRDLRNESGRIVGRLPPIRRFELSYLVSAWAGGVDEEHELLGLVLSAMPDGEELPEEHLVGNLRDQQLTVRVRAGVPGSTGVGMWDLWSSLGSPPRTSLELVATAPLVPPVVTELAPPARRLELGLSKEDATPDAKLAPQFGEPDSVGGTDTRPSAPAAAAADGDAEAEAGERKWTRYRVREHIPKRT